MAGNTILVVDDEQRMRKLVRDFLTKQNFRVLEAADGEEAVDVFMENKDIVLVILDVMMPKMDGWETCREIRQYSKVPIIMLTARGGENDELRGFELGVDEYIAKPFSPKILVARVEALLRRTNSANEKNLEYGGIVLNRSAHEVIIDGEKVDLSYKEFELLSYFMENKDMILSVDLADGDSQTGELEEVIQECPGLKIAIGHFGMVTRPNWLAQISLARYPNVRIESGGITWLFNDEFYPFPGAVKAIREAADRVGMDKLMWGSDYPRTITAITYRMSYDFILKTNELSESEKDRFLGENAASFYGFRELIELPYIKNMSE